MGAQYLTSQSAGIQFITDVFVNNKLFGEMWLLTALISVLTLLLITRNTGKWKLLLLPVLVMWNITGLYVGIALYAIGGLMYIMALVETGIVETFLNATTNVATDLGTSVARTGSFIGSKPIGYMQDKARINMAKKELNFEEKKIKVLNKREQNKLGNIKKKVNKEWVKDPNRIYNLGESGEKLNHKEYMAKINKEAQKRRNKEINRLYGNPRTVTNNKSNSKSFDPKSIKDLINYQEIKGINLDKTLSQNKKPINPQTLIDLMNFQKDKLETTKLEVEREKMKLLNNK